jgi:hypothetical protein
MRSLGIWAALAALGAVLIIENVSFALSTRSAPARTAQPTPVRTTVQQPKTIVQQPKTTLQPKTIVQQPKTTLQP